MKEKSDLIYTIGEIEKRLENAGAKRVHIDDFWRKYLAADPLNKPSKYAYSKAVQNELDVIQKELNNVSVLASSRADDGIRTVLKLSDNELIEIVLLPPQGLCISTQVGCAVGCLFCMSGKAGLIRQLTDLEIVTEVAIARRLQKVNKVVFMGMGEPSHNIRSVLSAVQLLAKYSGIGYKNLVVSTVGDKRLFDKLKVADVKPALAISLHSVFEEKRRKLLPNAPKISIEEILSFGLEYARLGGYPIQYQWTLIGGVNDTDEELDKLFTMWKNQYAVLNMIPVNYVEGSSFRRPSNERLNQIKERCKQAGILLKFRDSAAQEVQGGCGQLRARVIEQL